MVYCPLCKNDNFMNIKKIDIKLTTKQDFNGKYHSTVKIRLFICENCNNIFGKFIY